LICKKFIAYKQIAEATNLLFGYLCLRKKLQSDYNEYQKAIKSSNNSKRKNFV